MTTKTDYTKLDENIISAVSRGNNTFGLIELDARQAARKRAGLGVPRFPTMREIDRRLQALRTAGKIAYGGHKTGWTLATSEK